MQRHGGQTGLSGTTTSRSGVIDGGRMSWLSDERAEMIELIRLSDAGSDRGRN
jgi:hypothetical protein